MYKNTFAVITGDLIFSSKFKDQKRKELTDELKNAFDLANEMLSKINSKYNADIVIYPFNIYWGDSFRCVLTDPRYALDIVTIIRSHLKAVEWEYKRKSDARISIGIGSIYEETMSDEFMAWDGEAFHEAGRIFNQMSDKDLRLMIRTPSKKINDFMDVSCYFYDAILDNLSNRELNLVKEYVSTSVDSTSIQQEIAIKYNKDQSTISRWLNRKSITSLLNFHRYFHDNCEIFLSDFDSRIVNLKNQYEMTKREDLSSLKSETDKSVDIFVDVLRNSEDESIRRYAANELGQAKNEGATEALIREFEHNENKEVRVTAANALGQVKNLKVVDPLISGLKSDPSSKVRIAAANALGQIEDKKAVGALIWELEQDKSEEVRAAAADALGQIKAKDAVFPLIWVLGEDESEKVRAAAANALGQAKDKMAIEPLVKILSRDKSEEVRAAAANALGQIKAKDAVFPLIWVLGEDESEKVRVAAAYALGQTKDNAAIEALIKRLDRDESEKVRVAVAYALGQTKDNAAVEALIKRLDRDESEKVRVIAAYALRQDRGNAAIEALVKKLDHDKNGRD
ncbi:hypothetical protein FXV91_16190 [Methanosarcina sp. DH2]|uniref:SatD family protein n=1 Tax=Methanosarcina sp. DH2 TaxID=2605639 RepID=UPI001E2C6E3B|nr:SatD family protein [Methanosarcina sp. DH2]MCC4771646.1 hypothetical protein [Methanosarcina sp. DH2]